MDVRVLQELIECSVCLERMGPNSKVLPCQHTFCQPCLDAITRTRNELRCPECRTLVTASVADLPSNILLIRLLDSMKIAGGAGAVTDLAANSASAQDSGTLAANSGDAGPSAKALFDYDAHQPGDLAFKRGDRVTLRKRIDANWFYGELAGGSRAGFFPASYVQVITPLPPGHESAVTPKGRALYDFELNNEEEKDCLKLRKNDVVTIIRRVDYNWLEGRLNERVGIFPVSYVTLNEAAKSLVRGSGGTTAVTACAPVPVLQHPVASMPTPTASMASAVIAQWDVAAVAASPADFAASSRVKPRDSQDKNSLKRHSAASFPTACHSGDGAPVHSHRHSMEILSTNGVASSAIATSALSNLSASPSGSTAALHAKAVAVASLLQQPPPAATQTSSPVLPTRCHVVPNPVISSKQSGGIASQSIPIHVAMFNYKPQRDDELDLEKGKLYKVFDVCRDGWYRGVCLNSNRTGVFPGNYVQSVISLPKVDVVEHHSTSPPQLITAVEMPPTYMSDAASCAPEMQVGSVTDVGRFGAEQSYAGQSFSNAGGGDGVVFSQHSLQAIIPTWNTAHIITAPEKKRDRDNAAVKLGHSSKRRATACAESSKQTNPLAVPAATDLVTCAVGITQAQHSRSTSTPAGTVCSAGGETALDVLSSDAASHRKAGSLDSMLNDQSPSPRQSSTSLSAVPQSRKNPEKVHHLSKSMLRETYRCVVPYPAHCSTDLELLMGDVVLVHKKHENGWLKGTLQRTGKLGMFPASFLEKVSSA